MHEMAKWWYWINETLVINWLLNRPNTVHGSITPKKTLQGRAAVWQSSSGRESNCSLPALLWRWIVLICLQTKGNLPLKTFCRFSDRHNLFEPFLPTISGGNQQIPLGDMTDIALEYDISIFGPKSNSTILHYIIIISLCRPQHIYLPYQRSE